MHRGGFARKTGCDKLSFFLPQNNKKLSNFDNFLLTNGENGSIILLADGRLNLCLRPKGCCRYWKGMVIRMNVSKLAKFTNVFTNFMFYAGIAVCVSVPWVLKVASKYSEVFREYYWEMVIAFILSGVFAILIFFELKCMFRTVLAGDPFVMKNVVSLKRMGYYAFAIAAITVGRLTMSMTPAVFVVIIVFVVAGLFSLVLSQVFKQAVNYKLENDLTI